MKYTKAQKAQLDRPAKVLKTAHIPGPRRKPKHILDNVDVRVDKVIEETLVEADSTEAEPVVEAKPKPARGKTPKVRAAAKKKAAKKAKSLENPMKFGDIDE